MGTSRRQSWPSGEEACKGFGFQLQRWFPVERMINVLRWVNYLDQTALELEEKNIATAMTKLYHYQYDQMAHSTKVFDLVKPIGEP
jgi:hypothetical protein